MSLLSIRLQHAGRLEAERTVHRDRGRVGRIADHREHLPAAGGLAAGDELGQQQAAYALARRFRGEIDRVLQAEAIRRAWPEMIRVSKAEDAGGAVIGHVVCTRGDVDGEPALGLVPLSVARFRRIE